MLLVVAVVEQARGRRGVTGLMASRIASAVAVVLGVGAWNLRFVVFHDLVSLARVGGVVGLLALAMLVRVVGRRQGPEGGF